MAMARKLTLPDPASSAEQRIVPNTYAGGYMCDEIRFGSLAMTRESSMLRKIIDTIPVLAFCTLADGANEFTNQRWQDYTGLSQQDTSGWQWQVAIHPDDLAAVVESW